MSVTLTDEQFDKLEDLLIEAGWACQGTAYAKLQEALAIVRSLTREPAPVPDWRALAEELYRSCEKVGSWGEGTRVRSAMDAIENAMWPDIAEMEARERERAMTIDVKAMRERAEYVQRTNHVPPGGIKAACDDRAQLLALVDRQTELIRSAIMNCVCFGQHADDSSECEWCTDARALLRDIDGDARGGGRE